jgi:hypothetical protein
LIAAIILGGVGLTLVAAAAAGVVVPDGAFFGAGSALLAASLCFSVYWCGRPSTKALSGRGWWPVSRLGLRAATYRPARSVLSIAMISSATFILISVDAFRKEGAANGSRDSGTGGYSLFFETLIPVAHDPGGLEGREILGIAGMDSVAVEPFRVRPGDDASCLNLYAPSNPRILAPRDSFLASGRFAFRNSLALSEAEHSNPWLLLQREEPDGAIPVIADANSMTYVLKRRLGEDMVIVQNGQPLRLRFVAALRDSVFQSELLMSEANFLKAFPERQGYQFFLAETGAGTSEAVTMAVETALTDFGADVQSTVDRLEEFHRVENTYLSTFQMLGGLGLGLGTIGLGAVIIRNVMERRRELALLCAAGYRHGHILLMILAENAVLLTGGVVIGTSCALVAIAPVLIEQGGRFPVAGLLMVLCSVAGVGLIVSSGATASVLRSSVLTGLRAD